MLSRSNSAIETPGPILDQFEALETCLRSLRGQSVTALFNRGNRGDGLIHLGGIRLFAKLGLQVREVREVELRQKPNLQGDVLLVFANGAFCSATHSLLAGIQEVMAGFQRTIFLPGTYEMKCKPVSKFLRELDDRHTLFCRERVSFDSLLAAGLRAHVHLAHDLAFLVDLGAWSNRRHDGTAGLYRKDKEMVIRARLKFRNECDASAGNDQDVEGLLSYVSRFSSIHTDRTHGAISAAMMRRNVTLYGNSYFKNRAIFEHSLRHYENVKWGESGTIVPRRCLWRLYQIYFRDLEMKIRKAGQLFGKALRGESLRFK